MMRLPTVPTKYVVEHLNTVYFNQIWNAPDDHGRSNFQLNKVGTRMQTGAVPVGLSMVGLPTIDAVYAVYKTGYRGISRFTTLPDDTWVTDSWVLDNFGVTISVYTGAGRLCPLGGVYLRYISNKDVVLVAVSQKYTSKCTGVTFPNLFMTVDKDTTRHSPVVHQLFTVSTFVNSTATPQIVNTALTQAHLAYPKGTTVGVNGWVYDPLHVPTLVHGDVVSIVSDPDIIDVCDITVDDNGTGYYSTMYGEYREMLHIPKALNPNNYVITIDTLGFSIIDTATNRGIYGNKVNAHTLESITHNDFSISRALVQGFSNTLGAANVKLRLYIRLPSNPNYLRDDINHLSDLYILDDATIVNQLMNTASPQIPEWRASELEQSTFLNLMYAFTGFNASDILTQYASAVGYYDLGAVLGQQMRFYTYKGSQVQIQKPARLYGYDCAAVVYANGRKIPEGKFQINGYSTQTFTLGFTADSGVSIGDRVGVYIAEAGLRTPVLYTPTLATPQITLDNEDYELFERFTYPEAKAVWNTTADKGYHKIPLGSADYTVVQESDGSFTYEVRAKHYDKSFYLVPKFGMTSAQYDLTDEVTAAQPILIDLKTTDDQGGLIPIIGYETLEVYLNGYRLIENIDYECRPFIGDHSDVLQNLLVVSNCDYLDLQGNSNILEVVVHGDKVVSQDRGYAIENKLYRENKAMIWAPSSGRVFVHGKLQESVTELGNVVETQTDVENGAPFLIQCSMAYGVLKLLKELSPNEDINLRGRIDSILGIVPPTYPDIVTLEHLYALFSPFLAQIVSDVGNGVMTIVDEPSNERFLRQFSPYAPLLERDAVVGNNPLLDRRFITLAAHYANYSVLDSEQMLRVQRLVNLVLTPSELSIKEVLL